MTILLPCYVLLDLETTGATPTQDRITEIGLIRYENGVEVGRWNTLINPEVSISPFIQRLTGITQDMVSHAPTFAQVCETLLQWLDQAVVCAHNVRFDYGFLKSEFRRIGVSFQKKLLCTVKLSRTLYPQHHSHSLTAIIERFQLVCNQRHRAMGDTEMMAAFIDVAIREFGESTVQETARTLLKQQALPTGLDHLDIHTIPETCGVYLFHGDSALLYVGKSVSLRSRVFNHFQGDHRSAKEMRIAQEEIFGPVACLIPFRDEAHAIELANDIAFGLSSYVWTENLGRAHRVAAAIEAGMCFVNSQNVRDLRQPFGGTKASGTGREGGTWSYEVFCEPKNVAVSLGSHHIPHWGV